MTTLEKIFIRGELEFVLFLNFIKDNIVFTTEDFAIKGIADIIIDELNDSITNFVNKKDRNNQGYITLNDFKDIMEHDLKIDYKSDIDNLQIFFDFITSNKMIEGEDIIETKKFYRSNNSSFCII